MGEEKKDREITLLLASVVVHVEFSLKLVVVVPIATAEHPVSISSGRLGFGDLETDTIEMKMRARAGQRSSLESRVFDWRCAFEKRLRELTFHS